MVYIPPVTGTDVKKKVLGALDWLRDVNVEAYKKAGMTQEEAEQWYDNPGDVLDIKSRAPTEEQRLKGEENIKTALNLLTPRGVEDILLAGVTMRGAKAGWRGLKNILRPKTGAEKQIAQMTKDVKKMERQLRFKMAKSKIQLKALNAKQKAARAWESIKEPFAKEMRKIDIFYTGENINPTIKDKIKGFKLTESQIPDVEWPKTKKHLWQRFFGEKSGTPRAQSPAQIKRHIAGARKFVKDDMGSKEGFQRFLNSVFPEGRSVELPYGTGSRPAGKSPPNVSQLLNAQEIERVDLINYLTGDDDLYQVYKHLVSEAVDNTPYNLIIAQGKDIRWAGIHQSGGKYGKSGEVKLVHRIMEMWDSAFQGGFTKTHEFVHSVQLNRQPVMVKMSDSDLVDLVIKNNKSGSMKLTKSKLEQMILEAEHLGSGYISKKYNVLDIYGPELNTLNIDTYAKIMKHTGLDPENFRQLPVHIQKEIHERVVIKNISAKSRTGKSLQDVAGELLNLNQGRSRADMGMFQDFLDKNMKEHSKTLISPEHKSLLKELGIEDKEVSRKLEYLHNWWEVGARVNEIRHAEKLGLNKKTLENMGSQLELELIFPKEFIKKLKDNYWAFLPVGAGMWDNEGVWEQMVYKAEAE